jgi:hypothetical protein
LPARLYAGRLSPERRTGRRQIDMQGEFSGIDFDDAFRCMIYPDLRWRDLLSCNPPIMSTVVTGRDVKPAMPVAGRPPPANAEEGSDR